MKKSNSRNVQVAGTVQTWPGAHLQPAGEAGSEVGSERKRCWSQRVLWAIVSVRTLFFPFPFLKLTDSGEDSVFFLPLASVSVKSVLGYN